jgi:hypothetical protein
MPRSCVLRAVGSYCGRIAEISHDKPHRARNLIRCFAAMKMTQGNMGEGTKGVLFIQSLAYRPSIMQRPEKGESNGILRFNQKNQWRTYGIS